MNRDALLAQASRLARRYRLAPPDRTLRGPGGSHRGPGVGQSIDFHDYREYQPGDDLRRVDWRGYARTGTLHLKLFREEISPVVEVVLDTSASMGAYPGKEQTALFLAAFVAAAARGTGGRAVLRHGAAAYAGAAFENFLSRVEFAGPGLGPEPSASSNAARPWRFMVSDFLMPEGGRAVFARLSAGALAFTPTMVLSQSEREPDWPGGRRLVDVEAPERFLELNATPELFDEYRRRLDRHVDGLAAQAARRCGRLLTLPAPDGELSDEDLSRAVDSLARSGIVEPGDH